ncbi:MAG: type IIL restriction-modification enzyme MmeI, partial [Thermoleophilaceae bacterium]
PAPLLLDGQEVEGIDTALEESTIPLADVPAIERNRGRAFQGVISRGGGFVLSPEEAGELLAQAGADYRLVVRPYIGGQDIATDPRQRPSRFIIDFGAMSLEEAMQFPAALDVVRERVKPARDRDPVYADCWWRLWRSRPELRSATSGLARFIAGTATGKRILFTWCEPGWRASNATNVFALESDHAMGVLTSRIHTDWAAKKSSTLEDRIRYTPSSAFETFPWPTGTETQRQRIGDLGRELIAFRSRLSTEHAIGLTTLYNRTDEGAFQQLRSLHRDLDMAVVDAYGWEAAMLDDMRERNGRLYELNGRIVAGDLPYDPF